MNEVRIAPVPVWQGPENTLAHGVREPHDRVQRRPQFMREVGQKTRLTGAAGLGVAQRPHQCLLAFQPGAQIGKPAGQTLSGLGCKIALQPWRIPWAHRQAKARNAFSTGKVAGRFQGNDLRLGEAKGQRAPRPQVRRIGEACAPYPVDMTLGVQTEEESGELVAEVASIIGTLMAVSGELTRISLRRYGSRDANRSPDCRHGDRLDPPSTGRESKPRIAGG